jgi:hypothetical protein
MNDWKVSSFAGRQSLCLSGPTSSVSVTGSENGVLLQVWSTWLFFAVLVDLGDAVADEMELEFDRISLEMLQNF